MYQQSFLYPQHLQRKQHTAAAHATSLQTLLLTPVLLLLTLLLLCSFPAAGGRLLPATAPPGRAGHTRTAGASSSHVRRQR
jgi:hypothetical protein